MYFMILTCFTLCGMTGNIFDNDLPETWNIEYITCSIIKRHTYQPEGHKPMSLYWVCMCYGMEYGFSM